MKKSDLYLLTIAKVAVLEIETTFGIVTIELAIHDLAAGAYVANFLSINLYEKTKLPKALSEEEITIASLEEASLMLMNTGLFGQAEMPSGNTLH